MKFPPSHSRARAILETLMAAPATVYQGIERHSLLGFSENQIIAIYQQLEIDGCLIKAGMVYSVSAKARQRLAPPTQDAATSAPTEPAYRGNWQAPALSAASARRSGAAFGLNFRQ